MSIQSPKTEEELEERGKAIEGLSFAQLAEFTGLKIPTDPNKRKGWTGLAVELALGANAGNKALPDFIFLGIELKTLPLNHRGKPAESTFITSIPLLTIHQQTWENSQCYQKLKRVLWVMVEDDEKLNFAERRIGSPFLWSPSKSEEEALRDDWLELTSMIATGKLEEIDASLGRYLQIRPKAANANSLCYGFNAEGNKIATLPRGFYLRASFTSKLREDLT